ncbi:hypothetical protein Salat_2726300 [Sesamum alatum]|uniref:Uncharacterized protein n=1 Tax=Sesamum alatum TaxID=300844 RepID=A0AAE1XJU3_9LAMI|nr:hypothetical protein Salat_2726300 [Sesamum alatum]
MVGFKQEFNISEFFTLASRVFDTGNVQAMAAMKNLQDAWRLQFGEEVSPPPQTSMADPSRAVALKPTSAHVLTPFRLPQPEIHRERRVLSRDSAVSFDIPPTTSASFSASHPLAGVPPFCPENLSPSSAEYSLRASPSIAAPPGVIHPHFQADSSTSALQQLRSDSLQPNDSVSATFCTPENHVAAPSYMNEKTVAIQPCVAANFAANSSSPAALFWSEKLLLSSAALQQILLLIPSSLAAYFWSEKTVVVQPCVAANYIANSSSPAAHFWSKKLLLHLAQQQILRMFPQLKNILLLRPWPTNTLRLLSIRLHKVTNAHLLRLALMLLLHLPLGMIHPL